MEAEDSPRPNKISAPYEVPQFPIEQIEDKLKFHRQLSAMYVFPVLYESQYLKPYVLGIFLYSGYIRQNILCASNSLDLLEQHMAFYNSLYYYLLTYKSILYFSSRISPELWSEHPSMNLQRQLLRRMWPMCLVWTRWTTRLTISASSSVARRPQV